MPFRYFIVEWQEGELPLFYAVKNRLSLSSAATLCNQCDLDTLEDVFCSCKLAECID